MLRRRTGAMALVTAALAAACGGGASPGPASAPGGGAPTPAGISSGGPTGTSAAASSSVSASPPAPATAACSGGQLTAIVGAENSASGGQQGMTILLANDGDAACSLAGTLQAQLLDGSGNPLPTVLTGASGGQALLVPHRVALDPWWPQPGEATVLISWHTGDLQPGQCSVAVPPASAVELGLPGGGSVTADVARAQMVAPCRGMIALGPITQAAPGAGYSGVTGAVTAAVSAESGVQLSSGACTPTPQQSCLTVNAPATVGSSGDAAYQPFTLSGTGGGAICFAYAYREGGGWQPLDVTCVQAAGFNPVAGATIAPAVPGSACAPVYASAGHASSPLSCLPHGAPSATIDQGPVFVAETDPTTHLQDGTVWWHLQGQGWVTQDFLVEPD